MQPTRQGNGNSNARRGNPNSTRQGYAEVPHVADLELLQDLCIKCVASDDDPDKLIENTNFSVVAIVSETLYSLGNRAAYFGFIIIKMLLEDVVSLIQHGF